MAEHQVAKMSDDPIYKLLAGQKAAIASVLPKHLTSERMLRVAYQMIHKTPKLRNCTPGSLVNGLIEISMLGLDIGRTAHLVPFRQEATVIVDYKGLIDLAHRSGQINSFPLKAVYENDLFDYEEGTNRFIKHKPAPQNRGKLIAAYAIVNFKHGGFDFEVVHPVDIEAVKKVAPGARSADSPWNKPDQEQFMWMKTAARRLAKRIPQSPELTRVTELEDLVEAGLKQQISHISDDIIDTDFKVEEKKSTDNKSPDDIKKNLNERLTHMKNNQQTEPKITPEVNLGSDSAEDPKLQEAQAELKKKRLQAKADLEERDNGDLEKPNMIEWLWNARPSTSLKNAQEWLKAYKENEDTIDLLPNRDKRDKYYAKKAKVEQFIAENKPPDEPPVSVGQHEQDERRQAFVKYCQEANEAADIDVTQEVLTAFGYKTADQVPETDFGPIKRGISNKIDDMGIVI